MPMKTPKAVSPRWERPETVAAFVAGKPNQVLVAHVTTRMQAEGPLEILDIGCGAGRNAVPLAEMGCRVVGTDLSEPMIEAARLRAQGSPAADRLTFLCEPMAPLPFEDARFDLVIAHGVWNLATSDVEMRAGMAEAARVARPGASLFLFTFSRHTLREEAVPIAGETFAFVDFAAEPQCFLTEAEVLAELAAVGFVRDPPGPLTEYNRPGPGRPPTGGPVIWEGTFRRSA